VPQAGPGCADLISDDDEDNVEANPARGRGWAARLYPIDTTSPRALGANSVDLVAAPPGRNARLLHADVSAAWLPEPAASQVASDDALRLVPPCPQRGHRGHGVRAPPGRDRAVGLAAPGHPARSPT
jgi:hypothetical protein